MHLLSDAGLTSKMHLRFKTITLEEGSCKYARHAVKYAPVMFSLELEQRSLNSCMLLRDDSSQILGKLACVEMSSIVWCMIA